MSAKVPIVYVVDDDPSVCRALARLLGSAGHTVATYSSASEFLASYDARASGCLILDVRMPGMTGPELQTELRKRTSALPIIFITAQDDDDVHRQVVHNGAIAFFMKPVDDDDLLKAVAAALTIVERQSL